MKSKDGVSTLRRVKQWNRCDECGKFIAVADFERSATRRFLTPDSEFTAENYETLCAAHASAKAKRGKGK